MNIKQKIIGLALFISFMVAPVFMFAGDVSAACEDPNKCCGDVNTSIINCPQTNPSGGGVKDNAIWGVLLIALNILTAGVGIAAVGGIVYASILYTSAGDSAEQTKKAIEMIRNVVIGLVAYGLMYLVLNFLIPGGIFA